MLVLFKSEICGMSNHTSHTLISMFYELLSLIVLHPITRAFFMLKLNYLHSSPYPSKLILQSQSVAYLLLRLCSN